MLKTIRQELILRFIKTDTVEGIKRVGYRKYVGGKWEEIGNWQLETVRKLGLRPEHVFLDIACGSLRLGRLLIGEQDKGNYLGLDKHGELIDEGLRNEVPPEIVAAKAPEFVISDSFDFSGFSREPDFCWANSLFTHLTEEGMQLCLTNLKKIWKEGAVFYATFFEGRPNLASRFKPNANRNYFHQIQAVQEVGRRAGWRSEYIGNVGHPRKQVLIKFFG